MYLICASKHLTFIKCWAECTLYVCAYVTLEHKTSHKGQFYEIEINASSES